MKTSSSSPFILRSPLRALSAASLAVIMTATFSSTAPAAILAEWIQKNVSAGEAEPEPWNFADHVTVSKLTLHGSIYLSTTTSTKAMYQGWQTTLTESDYIGFTITADNGFSLDLDQLKSPFNNPTLDMTAWTWGYRIDSDRDGQYDTAWTYDTISNVSGGGVKLLALDINTAGTVEFGFFAAAPQGINSGYITPLSFNTRNNFELTGNVAAVPEPSTYGLIIIGTLAVLFFHRRAQGSVTRS